MSFETLPSVLFLKICALLTLRDQCAKLSGLNKSIKEGLRPAETIPFVGLRVCSEAQKAEQPGLARAYDASVRRVRYLPNAQAVQINCIAHALPPNRRKNIALGVRKALVEGRLRSLRINEYMLPSFTSQLLLDVGISTVRLQRLCLDVDYNEKCFDQAGNPRSFWGALRHCTSLKVLLISLYTANEDLDMMQRADDVGFAYLICEFPDSLEAVAIKTGAPVEAYFNIWKKYLTAPSFLPVMRRCQLQDTKGGKFNQSSFMPYIISTIMEKTQKVRPIDAYSRDLIAYDSIKQFPFVEMTLRNVSTECANKLDDSPNVWPDLKLLSIIFTVDTVDAMMAVVRLASRRRIEHLQVMTEGVHSAHLPFNIMNHVIQICSLRVLTLGSMMANECDDFSSLLTVNHWPNLRYLGLVGLNVSESLLGSVLSACPSIVQFNYKARFNTLSPALILAMVLFHCPSVAMIHMNSDTAENAVMTLRGVLDAFARYPIRNGKHEHLKGLDLTMLQSSPDAFEQLMSELRSAPHLVFAELPPAMTCASCLYATRHLHALHTSKLLLQVSPVLQSLCSTRLSSCIELVPKPGMFDEYDQDDLWEFPLAHFPKVGHFNLEDMINKFFDGPLYPVFKRSLDGRSGKEDFYELLVSLLDKPSVAEHSRERFMTFSM